MDTHEQTALGLPDLPGIEPGWELVQLRAPAKPGAWTAEQLGAKRDAILAALGEGLGVRQIARAFGVSPNSVLALRRNSGADIDTQKERAANRFGDLRDLAVDRMIDEIDQMPRQSLPIIAGVATDKAELLRGAPTVRIQHDHTLSIESVADLIASLPAAQPVGLEEAFPVKGESMDVMVQVIPPALVDDSVTRDSQSLVSAHLPESTGENKSENGPKSGQNGGVA